MITSKTVDQLSKPDASDSQEDNGPIAFFKEVYQAFERAEQVAVNSADRFYTIGGYVIRLRFAGPALVSLITPALEHLASPPSPVPALTICLWDSDSTGTDMPPPPPWSWNDYITRGEVQGYNDGRIHTAFHVNALSMMDAKLDLALCWVRDAGQLPYYESGSPLLRILHWWMHRHRLQLIHAGAVGTAEGGVLLVGKGGSGKSTTALACLDSELLYAGDDYCLITANPKAYVYSVYNSGKVDAKDTGRFSLLTPALSNSDRLSTEKALYFLYRHFPGKISAGFPIRAILLPRVTGILETRLKKVSSSLGLLALAPSTIFQLPGAGHQAFEILSKVAKQMPSYILEVGTDLSGIPDAISNLLSD